MKKIVFGCCLLFLLSCQEKTVTPSGLLNFVPPKTALLLKTADLKAFSKKLTNNSLLATNKNIPIQAYFSKTFSTFQHIPHTEESLLCFTKIGKKQVAYTFITQQASGFFKADKNDTATHTTFDYDGQQVRTYTWKNQKIFATKLNHTAIISDSKLMIENVIRMRANKLPANTELQKIYAASQKEASLFINNAQFKNLYQDFAPHQSVSFLSNFTDWSEIDLAMQQNEIQFNGVTKATQTTGKLINLFQGQQAKTTRTAEITPLNATGFYSFTYSDFDKLQDNLSFYRKKEEPKLALPGLFGGAQEISEIFSKAGTAIALRAKDTSVTRKVLAGAGKIVKTFRGSRIYNFNQPKLFREALYPLLKIRSLNYYAHLGDFFVFAGERKTLENLIANVQNQTVISNEAYFQHTKSKLNEKSSMFFLGINENLKNILAKSVPEDQQKAYGKLALKGYKTSALQFVYDTDFAYINGLISQAYPETATAENVTQETSIKVPEPLATKPQWVKNWRTKKMEIAVQGKSNTLYVYEPDGKLHWKKPLDGRILGKIQQIDIYNNGRLQLAFATQNKVYIFDKDGDVVSPFPKEYSATLTQPLAIFDYAHISHYRFLVVQGKKVSMFDKAGKTVTGFKYHQAGSTITQAPKHIRIGSKDYILIPEKSGKLHILNRVGRTRIPLKEKFDFSGNGWYDYQDKFTAINNRGELVQIDPQGRLHRQNLHLTENSSFIANKGTAVTFSENTLTIGNQKTELDFGLYTPPLLFEINHKTYVAVTDTQTSKVYLFDVKGKLLPGFPVYGNSAISLSASREKGKLQLLVQGEENSVLIYSVE